MTRIAFSPAGERDFRKLPLDIHRRIIEKITLHLSAERPLAFAKPLINLPPATHRFRVGKYRVCFYLETSSLVIDAVDTREDVYRRR